MEDLMNSSSVAALKTEDNVKVEIKTEPQNQK
jgi:hypothetical protein